MKKNLFSAAFIGVIAIFAALCVLTVFELVQNVSLSRRVDQMGGSSQSEEYRKIQSDLNHEKEANSQLQSQMGDLQKKYESLQSQLQDIQNMKLSQKSKVIYLTFDDGPSEYTASLLDALKQNQVNATFFVVGTNVDKFPDIVKREYAEGNAVGIHSWTHEYPYIYANQANFFADFNKLKDRLTDMLGVQPTICRFPGGSNNTVSMHYGDPHIMSQVVPQVTAMDIKYFDWNAYDGDADGKPETSAQVIAHVLAQVPHQKQSVVLCHDIKKTTVEAMPALIPQLKSMGYTFAVLNKDLNIPGAQFKPS